MTTAIFNGVEIEVLSQPKRHHWMITPLGGTVVLDGRTVCPGDIGFVDPSRLRDIRSYTSNTWSTPDSGE